MAKLIEIGVDDVCDVGDVNHACYLGEAKKNIENVNYLFDVNEVDVEDVGDANDGGHAMQMRKKCKLAPSPQQISNSNTAGAHALGK